ncbi:MAG: DNA polymerase IV [Cytophagaceae bacterium]
MRNIVHMDLDSFFVSVECLEHSELKGKPLIIGGHSDRGVVASCSYEARKFGVHSAMPSKMARKLCPDAIWLHGDMEKYSKYSRLITDIIAGKAPTFEKASIDEFYLDISGLDKFFGCFKWTDELKQYIIKESGLPISFGLSLNKLVSKVATNESKPNGQLLIPFGTEKNFLAPMPVKKIPMIGPKTAEHLNSLGIVTVSTLAAMPVKVLQSLYGKSGLVLWERANAIDETPVIPYTERKSISNETTFENDTIDVKMIRNTIIKMVEGLAFNLRKENWLTGCVTVKIKYSNFDTHTRQVSIPYTSMDEILIDKAKALFDQLYNRRMLIRLVGVRFSHLVHGNYQISLFDDPVKKIGFYEALDKIRKKYGDDSVGRAV